MNSFLTRFLFLVMVFQFSALMSLFVLTDEQKLLSSCKAYKTYAYDLTNAQHNAENLKNLINLDINVNIHDEESGNTPLHWVTYAYQTIPAYIVDSDKLKTIAMDLIKLLISKGSDINAKNNDNKKPIDLVTMHDKKEELFKAVPTLKASAVLTEESKEELTQNLLTACNSGTNPSRPYFNETTCNKIANYIKLGADVNRCIADKMTPLHFAVKSYKAAINMPNTNTEVNLNLNLIKLLVQHDADVNAKNNENKRPIDFVTDDTQKQELLAAIPELGGSKGKSSAAHPLTDALTKLNKQLEALKTKLGKLKTELGKLRGALG